MNKEMTEIVCIIDRSGSMHGLEEDTIGGFNQFIENQRKEDGLVYVTTVLFNQEVEFVYEHKNIQDVSLLNRKTYAVGGMTALLDSVGCSIQKMMVRRDILEEEKKANHIIFVIITDGLENASQQFDYPTIKKMIEKRKEAGWEFIFLGARIDAKEEANKLGIDDHHSVNFKEDSKGVGLAYKAVSRFTSAIRFYDDEEEWKEEVEEDYNLRKK